MCTMTIQYQTLLFAACVLRPRRTAQTFGRCENRVLHRTGVEELQPSLLCQCACRSLVVRHVSCSHLQSLLTLMRSSAPRSEERRVGKECRSGTWRDDD